MIIIDGTTYNVPIMSLKQKGEFLDKFAERTEDGVLHRELIGVYYNYELKFGRNATTAALAALWQKLSEPTEFHTVTVPDDGTDYTFTAYFSNVSRELVRAKESEAQRFWKDLTVNFISRSPAS